MEFCTEKLHSLTLTNIAISNRTGNQQTTCNMNVFLTTSFI